MGSVAEQIRRVLASPRRDELIAWIVKDLAVTARLDHAEDDLSRVRVRLNGLNEVSIILLSQLYSDLANRVGAYPDDVLGDVLLEAAVRGKCEGNLEWAVENAVRRLNGNVASS